MAANRINLDDYRLAYNKGDNPANQQWDFLEDAWVKGATPNSGALRTTGGGGGGSDVDIAVLRGTITPYMPVQVDASGNLLVSAVIQDAGGNPVVLPIGGTSPNDYVRVYNVAPAGGQYFASPASWLEAAAKLPLVDEYGRFIISPTVSQKVHTNRENHENGVRQAVFAMAATGVRTLAFASDGKLGEVRVSIPAASIEADVTIDIDGVPVDGGIVSPGQTVPFVLTVPPDVLATKVVTVTIVQTVGAVVPTNKVVIRGWYD